MDYLSPGPDNARQYLLDLGTPQWKVDSLGDGVAERIAGKIHGVSLLPRDAYYRIYMNVAIDSFFNGLEMHLTSGDPIQDWERVKNAITADFVQQTFELENTLCSEIDRVRTIMTKSEFDRVRYGMIMMCGRSLTKAERLLNFYRMVDSREVVDGLVHYMGDDGIVFLFFPPFGYAKLDTVIEYLRNDVPIEWARTALWVDSSSQSPI